MIVLREYKDCDLENIRYTLKQEDIKDLNLEGIVYVVLDDKNLIGVGKVQLEDCKCFLRYLVIKKEERKKGYGDALLRAILYKLENNNIKKLYFKGNSEYLLKKDFKNKTKGILSINISEFFTNSCNCSGEYHGI